MNQVHAYLITGGDTQSRQNKAEKIIINYQEKKDLNLDHNPDILIFQEKDSIKIAQVREIKKKLQLKPYSQKFKICLILEAEKLTLAAQNALLKTLEEPPEHSLIILTSNQPDLLLPTILSRVQVIKLPLALENSTFNKILQENDEIAKIILSQRLGERIKLAEKLAKSNLEALQFTVDQLNLWRYWLLVKLSATNKPLKIPNLSVSEIISTIRRIRQTYIYLDSQVNPRLAIENLLIFYPKKPFKIEQKLI